MFLVISKNNQVCLKLLVQPKAKRTCIVGVHGDMLKLAVAAPPVDGKANKQVISFFSDIFGIRKSTIKILSGQHSRKKTCLIEELEEMAVRSALEPYL